MQIAHSLEHVKALTLFYFILFLFYNLYVIQITLILLYSILVRII